MLEKIDGNMPIYANLQKNRNGLKAGKYEVFEYDQGAIRMPRQDTNIEAEMPILAGYTGYGLWICTSFAPFEFTKERIVNNKESLKTRLQYGKLRHG